MKLLAQWPKPLRGGVRSSTATATSQSPRDVTSDLNSAQSEQNNLLDERKYFIYVFTSWLFIFQVTMSWSCDQFKIAVTESTLFPWCQLLFKPWPCIQHDIIIRSIITHILPLVVWMDRRLWAIAPQPRQRLHNVLVANSNVLQHRSADRNNH